MTRDDHNAKLLSASTEKYHSAVTNASGCKGLYSLRKLPSHDHLYNTPIDPMHLVKNIAEHIVKLLSGKADTEHVRNEERNRKHFRSAWVTTAVQAGKKIHPSPCSFQSIDRFDLLCKILVFLMK